MSRRAKPSKGKAGAKRPLARKSPKNEGAKLRDLQKRLAESLEREKATGEILREKARALTEALEQQTATAQILGVIASSPTELQPVFETILARAVRLCGAEYANLFRFDGERQHSVTGYNTPPAMREALSRQYPMVPARGRMSGRAILERRIVHVPDLLAEPEYQGSTALVGGFRSNLAVPMMREGEPIGVIVINRMEKGPFTDQQISLLRTFADQAVIAVENVRLFTELQQKNEALRQAHAQVTEALEQQTATSEVLKVISRSAFDLQPVFETLAENAVRLCDARRAFIFRVDGEVLRAAASYNASPELIEAVRANPIVPGRHSVTARAALERRTVHIADVQADPEFSYVAGRVDPVRTMLSVPMLTGNVLVGVMTIYKLEVAPFTDKQIALVETFADQAVIAVENVRLFTELEARNRDLTATGEILRVISSSPTDVQPVFDAIARNARGLLGGHTVSVARLIGDELHLMAFNARDAAADAVLQGFFPVPVDRFVEVGRVVRERTPVIVSDTDTDPRISADIRELGRARGWRSVIWMPMVRDEASIGMIAVSRRDPGPFADGEVALLKTFADQAVIAIENVRLFTELRTSNRELTTALDTQTATSDILRVISRSQTDVQPVFEAILASAVRLLGAYSGALTRIEGDQIALAAMTSTDDAGDAVMRAFFPQSRESGGPHPRVIRDRAPLNIADAPTDSRLSEAAHANALARGYRSQAAVPLLRQDEAVGTISVTRSEPGGFTDDEIGLLQTFADQAVIAIENARLLSELQQKNEALTQAHAQVTEALEKQTATAEILRVISRSPTDVQPVFDTIVRSAVRLCNGLFSGLFQFDGEMIHHVAQHNFTPEALEEMRRTFPIRPTRTLLAGRSILERAVVHIPDIEVDPEYQHHALARAVGQRSCLFVPMLREGTPIGVISVARAEPGPFSGSEVELLKIFADQAVIAVENVRLFKELEARTGELTQSVEKLTALGEVSRAVSSTLDVETVLDTIVSRASQLAGAAGCSIYEYDVATQQFELRATHNDDTEFVAALRAVPFRKGEGLMGRAAEMREPIQIPDITQPGAYQSSVRDTLIRFGYRALLSVPLLREDQVIGSLSFNRKVPGEFPPEVVDVLKTFATQSALAIQNARLYYEIERKSRELEVASQHKSEFLANMSHELRTPLNAIIGFSEVLVDRMFGELNEKQDEYLKDIYASGQHLLSLINDILDLSKVEAGRMELELADFHLPNAIDNALILVQERASRRGIRLGHSVDEWVGTIQGDERKIKQVLLNLLSNALKFTPEGGRIDVSARLQDGVAEISVVDTGVGIRPEDQEAVFEEFRQVGTADKKVEGTGLGLALSRKFIELHGGRIWVRSQLGQGSTFTFTLPVRREN